MPPWLIAGWGGGGTKPFITVLSIYSVLQELGTRASLQALITADQLQFSQIHCHEQHSHSSCTLWLSFAGTMYQLVWKRYSAISIAAAAAETQATPKCVRVWSLVWHMNVNEDSRECPEHWHARVVVHTNCVVSSSYSLLHTWSGQAQVRVSNSNRQFADSKENKPAGHSHATLVRRTQT